MQPNRKTQIAVIFGVQLVNSIVHHTTHSQPVIGSISVIDMVCTLVLIVSLIYLGDQASQSSRPLVSGALWALLLWVFGVCASASVMRLVDPPSMDLTALAAALGALVVLAPVALGLGALGAFRATRQVTA
jgi:hypothetical protein